MWKEIPDTDGLYFANEFGNIKSSSRSVKLVSHNKASYYMRAGKILKQPLNSHGYPCVTIKYLNGTQKVVQVHRLIAKTFIPNPDNLPQINHIDGNKCNNNVQNLEWCSVRDNIRHAYKTGLNQGSKPWLGKVGKMHPNSIPVIALNLDGSLYKEYESISLAAKDVGMCSSSHISACLHGHRKSAGGFIWKFKN
jgi:hypothetical protein